jgi:hypothetical protein
MRTVRDGQAAWARAWVPNSTWVASNAEAARIDRNSKDLFIHVPSSKPRGFNGAAERAAGQAWHRIRNLIQINVTLSNKQKTANLIS